eukprot:TRINITY_DN7734_c0_g1_i2.p1 TRINITY_DN7734_c0_g1~~TRINITY_DN7734_c0_g1_i2.p1  ORF type:complete len:203 (-),score=57.81 TRINITY_DN7734_c0_g1_i2:60-608(-)
MAAAAAVPQGSCSSNCNNDDTGGAQAPQLATLPADVLGHIFGMLRWSDLCALCLVCRFFNIVVKNDDQLWEGLCRRYFGEIPDHERCKDIVFGKDTEWRLTFLKKQVHVQKQVRRLAAEEKQLEQKRQTATECPYCHACSITTELFQRNISYCLVATCSYKLGGCGKKFSLDASGPLCRNFM